MDKLLDGKTLVRVLFPIGLLIAAIELLVWAHWSSLSEVAGEWRNDKYSHGYLVPIFAAVLLYLRRDEDTEVDPRVAQIGIGLSGVGLLLCVLHLLLPDVMQTVGNSIGRTTVEAIGLSLCIAGVLLFIQQRVPFESVSMVDRWIGLACLIVGEIIWLVGTVYSAAVVEYYAFLPSLVGVFLMVGGRKMIQWAGWSIFFLVFMFPLQSTVDKYVAGSLQSVATQASEFILQTLGYEPTREGNIIKIPSGESERRLFVAEACSGLRMLTIFGAMSVAVALLIKRPLWQRLTIVVSAVPIALLANIVRIVLTGIIFTWLPEGDTWIHDFVHTSWGYMMMPMGLGMMYLEFLVLDNLVLEDDEELPLPMTHGKSGEKALPAPGLALAQPAPAVSPAKGGAAREPVGKS